MVKESSLHVIWNTLTVFLLSRADLCLYFHHLVPNILHRPFSQAMIINYLQDFNSEVLKDFNSEVLRLNSAQRASTRNANLSNIQILTFQPCQLLQTLTKTLCLVQLISQSWPVMGNQKPCRCWLILAPYLTQRQAGSIWGTSELLNECHKGSEITL